MSLVGGYPPQPYTSSPATDLYYHPPHHHPHHGGAGGGGPVGNMGMSHHGHMQSRYPDHAPADSGGYFSSAWMLGGGGGAPGDMAADGYLTGPGGHPGDHYSMLTMMSDCAPLGAPVRFRVVKRRCTANKKERRRTVSINTAFANLRGCIPNVPSDTKLSKIKTLRLATSYIAYLMDVLNKDDPKLAEGGFKAEIAKKTETREERRRKEQEEMMNGGRTGSGNVGSPAASDGSSGGCGASSSSGAPSAKKGKGRTGWPQHVWAAELKS